MVSNSEACNYQLAVRSQQGVRVHVNDREDLATSENRAFKLDITLRHFGEIDASKGNVGAPGRLICSPLPAPGCSTNKSLPHAARLLRARQRAAHQ